MKDLAKFSKQLLRSLTRKKIRYIRLTPNETGRIYFYDKLRKCFFSVITNEKTGSGTADHIFTNHNYDLTFLSRYDELQERYSGILSSGKTPLILDCGSNIGLSSVYFATTFPDAMVIALEPEKANFRALSKNCGSFSNITLCNNAVGSVSGMVSIDNADAASDAFRTSRAPDGQGEVQVVTINKILGENHDVEPFIAKIDIEGFEDDLFSANTEWVEKFFLIIIETHDWMLPKQANSKNFLKVISVCDRDFLHRGENIYSIMND